MPQFSLRRLFLSVALLACSLGCLRVLLAQSEPFSDGLVLLLLMLTPILFGAAVGTLFNQYYAGAFTALLLALVLFGMVFQITAIGNS